MFPASELERLPCPGPVEPERNPQRRQNLGAIQGDIPLGIDGGLESLQIDRRANDFPNRRLRLCVAGSGSHKRQRGQTDHGSSDCHVFLRRKEAGKPALGLGRRPCLYISGPLQGKEQRAWHRTPVPRAPLRGPARGS